MPQLGDINKEAKSSSPLNDIIRKRWSPRAFADRPVEREKLLSVLEAARWAPSSFNEQPWRIIIATRDDEENYRKLLGVMGEFNQNWAQSAPVLLLTVASAKFAHNGKPNRHAWHDVGLASENMFLQAVDEGLFMHFMAGFDPDKTREVFAIPEDYEPVATAALGYLGELDRIPEDMRKMETGERSRKNLSEFIFSGSFGAVSPLVE